MGAASARKRAFFEAHPICCFCSKAAAVTEDHVPARVCFKQRAWPESFVFPACKECNALDKDSELVVAFYIHSMTDNAVEFQNAFSGLKNNFPETLPNPFVSLGTKATALSNRGLTLPTHLIAHAPIVTLPPDMHQHFHRFGRKLAKAFYYRGVGSPIHEDFRILTHWTTFDQPGASEMINLAVNMLPILEIGGRSNMELGNQFSYRVAATANQDVFAFTANFSDKIFITGIGADKRSGADLERFLSLPSWREIPE